MYHKLVESVSSQLCSHYKLVVSGEIRIKTLGYDLNWIEFKERPYMFMQK
jgi:hypothetical protein